VQARKSISEQITKLPEQMATLERTREMFRSGDFQRQMADARKSMESALAQIDAQSAMLRAAGQDPEKVKREMRKSLEEMRRTDPAKIARESMLSVDPAKLSSEILNASKSIDEIEAKLNRLERR
jgi:predicted metal-dependent peptidase